MLGAVSSYDSYRLEMSRYLNEACAHDYTVTRELNDTISGVVLSLEGRRHLPFGLVHRVHVLECVRFALLCFCDHRRREPAIVGAAPNACSVREGAPPSASAFTESAPSTVTVFAPIGMQSSNPLIISSGGVSLSRKLFCASASTNACNEGVKRWQGGHQTLGG